MSLAAFNCNSFSGKNLDLDSCNFFGFYEVLVFAETITSVKKFVR